MEEKKETIYRFNGDEALQKASPGKAFYLVTEDVASGKSKKVFIPILVLDVHISGGPERFYIHAFICKKTKNTYLGLKYEITVQRRQAKNKSSLESFWWFPCCEEKCGNRNQGNKNDCRTC